MRSQRVAQVLQWCGVCGVVVRFTKGRLSQIQQYLLHFCAGSEQSLAEVDRRLRLSHDSRRLDRDRRELDLEMVRGVSISYTLSLDRAKRDSVCEMNRRRF